LTMNARSSDARTWVVGRGDDSGLVTQCLLALQGSFDLPPCVAIARDPAPRADRVTSPTNVLAFVPIRALDASRAELLREDEAARLVLGVGSASPAPGRPNVVAVAVDEHDPAPVEKAVRLAVTTLIDWGHEITCRRRDAAS
jgi:hypothetical protein